MSTQIIIASAIASNGNKGPVAGHKGGLMIEFDDIDVFIEYFDWLTGQWVPST